MHVLFFFALLLALLQLASTAPTCSGCNPGMSDHLIYLFPRRGGGSTGARGSSSSTSSSSSSSAKGGSSSGTKGSSSSGTKGSSSSGTKGGSSIGIVNGSSGGKTSSTSGGTWSRSDQTGSGYSSSGWIADSLLLDDDTDNGVTALTPARTIWVAGLVAGTVVLGGFGI